VAQDRVAGDELLDALERRLDHGEQPQRLVVGTVAGEAGLPRAAQTGRSPACALPDADPRDDVWHGPCPRSEDLGIVVEKKYCALIHWATTSGAVRSFCQPAVPSGSMRCVV
jgi:hypothetical protein